MSIDTFVIKINELVTPRRLKYPYIVGTFLWAGWIISIILGEGNTDLAGNLIGTDFAAFFTAGKIILLGKSPQLYDLNLAYSIQQSISVNQNIGFYPYLNPPQYALFMIPFSVFPYPFAPLIWIIFNLGLLYLSVSILAPKNRNQIYLFALTWFPVFCGASFGQNAFLSLFLFCLTHYLSSRQRNFLAGIVYSLLLFKPQFLIAFSIFWILDFRKYWKQLLGLSLGFLLQVSLIWFFLPDAGFSYLKYLNSTVLNLSKIEGFPIWHAFSVDAFWSMLFPSNLWLSRVIYILSCLIATYFFFSILSKYKKISEISYSLVLIWLVLFIPYIMVYDWTLLLFPAIILWKNWTEFHPLFRACFSILWISSFVSSVFSQLQLRILPFAIQISVVSLVFIIVIIYQKAHEHFHDQSHFI